jgi:hypothetical protein
MEHADPLAVHGLRRLFVGADTSVAERLRRRRWALVCNHFPSLSTLRVLDLGGTSTFWTRAPVRPRHVTIVNLHVSGQAEAGLTEVQGDALQADTLVGGQHFDLVFSHSLIEHLGGHASRRRFAEVVRAMAPAYVVQTPWRYFPIEPHWIFPGFQFLPLAVRCRLAPRWPLGHTRGWDADAASEEVMSTELLSAREMGNLFPDGLLVWESVAGLPKSMYAIRKPLHGV